jgi:hypothetical protein
MFISATAGELHSFLSLFFPRALYVYQTNFQSQHPVRRPSRSSSNNLQSQSQSHESNPQQTTDNLSHPPYHTSPPRRERSSSYSSSQQSTTASVDTTAALASALAETEREFDSLESDIALMWSSLQYVPASPCTTPAHRHPPSPQPPTLTSPTKRSPRSAPAVESVSQLLLADEEMSDFRSSLGLSIDVGDLQAASKDEALSETFTDPLSPASCEPQCCDYESGCGCPTPTETSQQGRVCSPKMETEAAHQSRKVVSPHPLQSKEEGEERSAAGPPNQLRSSGAPFPLSFLSSLPPHCLQTSVP